MLPNYGCSVFQSRRAIMQGGEFMDKVDKETRNYGIIRLNLKMTTELNRC